MGLFDKLFKRKTKAGQTKSIDRTALPEKCRDVLALKDAIDEVLNRNAYISKKDYVSVIKEFKGVRWIRKIEKVVEMWQRQAITIMTN